MSIYSWLVVLVKLIYDALRDSRDSTDLRFIRIYVPRDTYIRDSVKVEEK